MAVGPAGVWKKQFRLRKIWLTFITFVGIGGKLLVLRKNIVVSEDSIGIDKYLTKDRNLNTFKMYCKRRKSSARFPDRKARNRLCACHCIAGNVKIRMDTQWAPVHKHARRFSCHRVRRCVGGQEKVLKLLVEAERLAACAHCGFEGLHEAFHKAVG